MSQNHHGYKFFTIIDEGRNKVVKKIVASQALEAEMASIFEEQATAFLDPDIRRIPFDPRYTANAHEMFHVKEYDLPDSIKAALASWLRR